MRPFPEGADDAPDGNMLSFNHYAYGAVVDWIYRHVAGIAPAAPGYRSIRIAPRPVAGLDRAEASIDNAVREASVAGHSGLTVFASNWTSRLARAPCSTCRPAHRSSPSTAARRDALIDAGRHELLVTHPLIVARGDAAVTAHSEPARAS